MKISDFSNASMLLGLAFGYIGGVLFFANHFSFVVGIFAFLLPPVTVIVAPIYKWIALGDPKLFIWSYGLILFGFVISKR